MATKALSNNNCQIILWYRDFLPYIIKYSLKNCPLFNKKL